MISRIFMLKSFRKNKENKGQIPLSLIFDLRKIGMKKKFKKLLDEVRGCKVCQKYLTHKVRPILSVHPSAKILIIGQAPGKKVHDFGIPWDDPSGNRLREWMSIDQEIFYDESKIAIMPMGFCYPGKGKSGDFPPRPECAPLWHGKLLKELSHINLTLLVGQYAQAYYLKEPRKSLTQTVKEWKKYAPHYLPLPHPSPRNFIWFNKNPWFEKEVVTYLQKNIRNILRNR